MVSPAAYTAKQHCLILCYLAGVQSGGILYAFVNIKQKEITWLTDVFSSI